MFYITFGNLPDTSCVELLSQGQFYGGGTDIDSIIANKTFAWRYPYSLYKTDGIANVNTVTIQPGQTGGSIEINISEAVKSCTQKQNNEITWIFS